MGGAFRATAIFLAAALVIGWPGVAVRADSAPDESANQIQVREHPCTQPYGAVYYGVLHFSECCISPCHTPPRERHASFVVGSAACDNKISCIRLSPNHAVKVFEHNNFEGRSAIFRKSVNLPGTSWNDRISSFIVFCRKQPEPKGIQVYLHYSTTFSGGRYQFKFIPAPDYLNLYRIQYASWPHSSRRLDRIVRTSLDVAWRACFGKNFTGQCVTVPRHPNDKRFDVWLPGWLRGHVHSLEMWLISQADKYKCTDHGGGIVSCPYAQMQKATVQGVRARPFWWTTGAGQVHRAPPAPSPPPRMAIRPPVRPGQVYRPPVRVPGPAGVTSEPNVDRPGLDYRRLAMPAGGAEACRRACLGDPRCRAYTYVRPGFQGRRAWCWLKHGVPRPIERRCCVSGVKTGRVGPGPRPGYQPGVSGRCPPGQHWNARLRRCVCLPGHWWNSRLRRCVRRVAPGRPPMVRRCPPGQYWNARLRRCICRPGHWWNARLRRCVRRAGPGRPPVVRRCPPGQHWNAGLRRCVCPPGLWWNARQRRCVRRALRPRPPITRRCPPGQQWSPQAKRCLPVVR